MKLALRNAPFQNCFQPPTVFVEDVADRVLFDGVEDDDLLLSDLALSLQSASIVNNDDEDGLLMDLDSTFQVLS